MDPFTNEPKPTSSLWGEMFGLGPLMRLIQDPQLGAKTHQAVQAIIDGHARMVRIEAKLDALLQGVPYADTAAPAVFARLSDGPGGPTVASSTADDGSGGDAIGAQQPSRAADANGHDHQAGGDRPLRHGGD